MLQNLCDTHTHTLYSRHAYSTIRENVLVAHDAGLELLASTDHFSSMLYNTGDLRDFQFFINFGVWPRVWEGVKLMHGCEADIVDLEGHLFGWDITIERNITGDIYHNPQTLKQRVFNRCDYVIASIHGKDFCKDATRSQMTEMYIKVLQQPKVLTIGHIGRSGLDVEFRPIIKEATRLHKLIEINDHSLDNGASTGVERCREVATICAEEGCKVAVNTDAHICAEIGRFDRALGLLESVSFPQELIATTNAQTFIDVYNEALGEVAKPLNFEE